jgi:spore coat protein A
MRRCRLLCSCMLFVALLVALAAIPALAVDEPTLDPTSIDKYVTDLVIPPAMPITARVAVPGGSSADYYEIGVHQFQQQILPPNLPMTTVWSYRSETFPETLNYPAFTIEAKVGREVIVKWINGLVDEDGNFLPHLLPVDPTLHWANPPGGEAGRDMRPEFEETPGPYTGPVPIITHVHGAHTYEDSDGYPEAWYLPDANDIPDDFATVGTQYGPFQEESPFGDSWGPGSAIFRYPNDQRATTLWYHDHTLGMTRLNVYAGPAGFYLLRGGQADLPVHLLPGPAPGPRDRPGTRYYEIPIVIQGRSFNSDGSLFYPNSREFFDGFDGPFIPDSDISPIWNPETFANTIVVNGRTWPKLDVEARRYRFRFLNGNQARFLILKLVSDALADRPAEAALPFWQIGSDGGFLRAPVMLDQLLMGPAERADVIVDFTGLEDGTEIYLINEGPDEPFGGGTPGVDFAPADPNTTGQVMKFVVGPRLSVDTSMPPYRLHLPPLFPLGAASNVRQVSLNEEDSAVLEDVGPRAALLGTIDEDGLPVHKLWMDEITENPALGATEVWEIYNFTMDAHPIHIHQVQFQVVNRQGLVLTEDELPQQPVQLLGDPIAPEVWETGYKDTVVAYPGMVTRVKARFDIPGLFVWHCHILEHEDNEMMRPYRVVPPES